MARTRGVRNWAIGVLAFAALILALASYHLFVLRRSAEHYRLLLECSTVEEKRFHYDEIHRYFHPWNPYGDRVEQWLQEEGHEWEFLRLKRTRS